MVHALTYLASFHLACLYGVLWVIEGRAERDATPSNRALQL